MPPKPQIERPTAGDRFTRATFRSISIVVPAYNEELRLGETLDTLLRFARGRGDVHEILIVDDGSTDGTRPIVERAVSANTEHAECLVDIRLLGFKRNFGKGHAVRRGMLAATGDAVLMTDADLSTPLEELDRLLPWLSEGCDVVIGSRDMPDSRLDPPQPLPRRLAAWSFRALRRRLLLPELRDTQCGFKLFTREAVAVVFPRQSEDGWLFDCEVLALAARMGLRIKEVGVIWRHAPHSRVRVWREAIRALPTLLRIRRRVQRREI